MVVALTSPTIWCRTMVFSQIICSVFLELYGSLTIVLIFFVVFSVNFLSEKIIYKYNLITWLPDCTAFSGYWPAGLPSVWRGLGPTMSTGQQWFPTFGSPGTADKLLKKHTHNTNFRSTGARTYTCPSSFVCFCILTAFQDDPSMRSY